MGKQEGGTALNKLLFGAAVGMMAGMALMMSPAGKTLRKDMNMGMTKAKEMARKMDMM